MPISRNYSFIHKNRDVLDQVKVNGIVFSIPARIGSCFWAILKVGYVNANRPIPADALTDAVAALMTDRDAQAWNAYCAKPGRLPWRERLLLTAQMLTRQTGNNPYGLRLAERCHRLSFEKNEQGLRYFILRTTNAGPTR